MQRRSPRCHEGIEGSLSPYSLNRRTPPSAGLGVNASHRNADVTRVTSRSTIGWRLPTQTLIAILAIATNPADA
jgi:hypothetical protein